MNESITSSRRSFIKHAAVLAGIGGIVLPTVSAAYLPNDEENIHIVGPRQGFSPQIGTLVSMMN
jgi:hypothetical protein